MEMKLKSFPCLRRGLVLFIQTSRCSIHRSIYAPVVATASQGGEGTGTLKYRTTCKLLGLERHLDLRSQHAMTHGYAKVRIN